MSADFITAPIFYVPVLKGYYPHFPLWRWPCNCQVQCSFFSPCCGDFLSAGVSWDGYFQFLVPHNLCCWPVFLVPLRSLLCMLVFQVVSPIFSSCMEALWIFFLSKRATERMAFLQHGGGLLNLEKKTLLRPTCSTSHYN